MPILRVWNPRPEDRSFEPDTAGVCAVMLGLVFRPRPLEPFDLEVLEETWISIVHNGRYELLSERVSEHGLRLGLVLHDHAPGGSPSDEVLDLSTQDRTAANLRPEERCRPPWLFRPGDFLWIRFSRVFDGERQDVEAPVEVSFIGLEYSGRDALQLLKASTLARHYATEPGAPIVALERVQQTLEDLLVPPEKP